MEFLKGIKTAIESYVDGSVNFELFVCRSKNSLFKVNCRGETFFLKVFVSDLKDSGSVANSLQSYDNEVFALKLFSGLNEVPKLLLCNREQCFPWVMTEFFDGKTLKELKDDSLYFRAVELLVRLHFIPPDKSQDKFAVSKYYFGKIQEVEARFKSYLPAEQDSCAVAILNNLYLVIPAIVAASNRIVHGDFVDRNVLAKGDKLMLVDFENSRFGPACEDMIFFVSEIKDVQLRSRLLEYYKNASLAEFDNKIFVIVELITLFRSLGSLLRIKCEELPKYADKINNYLQSIERLAKILRDEFHLDLFEEGRNKWDETFRRQGNFFGETHPEFEKFVQNMIGQKIFFLDLGSGSGRHTIYLAKKGFKITALDSSSKGIELTREQLNQAGLSAELVCADMYKGMPFKENSFDCVVSVQALHHSTISNIRRIISEINRVLKPGGKIFITVPKIRNISYKNPIEIEKNTFVPLQGHEKGLIHHYFDENELKELFKNFTIIINEDEYNHFVISGKKLISF